MRYYEALIKHNSNNFHFYNGSAMLGELRYSKVRFQIDVNDIKINLIAVNAHTHTHIL